MHLAAVLVAAGSGARLGGPPKQWRMLAGRPVARWAAEGLLASGVEHIVVVVPPGGEADAKEALAGLPRWTAVPGGAARTDSVRAGLAALAEARPAVVLVHDAARPFVQPRHVAPLLDALAHAEGAAPALPVADTLKRARDGMVEGTASREGLHRIQTPQAFGYDTLVRAYAALAAGEEATDDAGVVERAGGRVRLTPGDPRLDKLTRPEDFSMAESVAGGARITVVGHGIDAHRFGPGESVWLCGVEIPHAHGLVGHSDADAGLHALTDAMLGAISAGDIGDHFPPSDPQWRGAPSSLFVEHALKLIAARGGRLLNADITLIAERPRVKAHREPMRARVAELLGLPLKRVSVKATTTERMGFVGREEGLAAEAVVSVQLPE
jgi:2-C-methyl-D-erythritol 4-phosphate cytidylyltransferase/2-C-methyl-D-erythritol 2,4-cyclodiphosphate synthase